MADSSTDPAARRYPAQGHQPDHPTVPPWALWAAGALILGSLLFAAVASQGGYGAVRLAAPVAVESRLLILESRGDGSVGVYDPAAGERRPIALIAQEDAGFIGGVLRALERDRRAHSVPVRGLSAPPYELSRSAEGRLSLFDAETGRRIEIGGFGRTHYETFFTLLRASATETEAGR